MVVTGVSTRSRHEVEPASWHVAFIASGWSGAALATTSWLIVACGDMVGTSIQTVTAVRSRPTPEVSLAMAKPQEVLTRVAMCPSSHHGYFCTAAALPCHPCGLRMLKDSHGLAAMLRAGTALAPFIRQ